MFLSFNESVVLFYNYVNRNSHLKERHLTLIAWLLDIKQLKINVFVLLTPFGNYVWNKAERVSQMFALHALFDQASLISVCSVNFYVQFISNCSRVSNSVCDESCFNPFLNWFPLYSWGVYFYFFLHLYITFILVLPFWIKDNIVGVYLSVLECSIVCLKETVKLLIVNQ